jgi:hypothetical protein
MDKQLITLINKLQDVFATVGVSSDSINLPQITVGAFGRWAYDKPGAEYVQLQSDRNLRESRV